MKYTFKNVMILGLGCLLGFTLLLGQLAQYRLHADCGGRCDFLYNG